MEQVEAGQQDVDAVKDGGVEPERHQIQRAHERHAREEREQRYIDQVLRADPLREVVRAFDRDGDLCRLFGRVGHDDFLGGPGGERDFRCEITIGEPTRAERTVLVVGQQFLVGRRTVPFSVHGIDVELFDIGKLDRKSPRCGMRRWVVQNRAEPVSRPREPEIDELRLHRTEGLRPIEPKNVVDGQGFAGIFQIANVWREIVLEAVRLEVDRIGKDQLCTGNRACYGQTPKQA